MNRFKPGLRYLPTTEELQELSLSKSERERRALGLKSPANRIFEFAARLLESRGLHASTCAIWQVYEVVAEAKLHLGITCSLRAYIIAACDNPGGSARPERMPM